jgi:hypothetical protein
MGKKFKHENKASEVPEENEAEFLSCWVGLRRPF